MVLAITVLDKQTLYFFSPFSIKTMLYEIQNDISGGGEKKPHVIHFFRSELCFSYSREYFLCSGSLSCF